jgi:hypothetical protein
MPVKIVNSGHNFRVEWLGTDGFYRDRTFASYSRAQRYAFQLECRLLLETMLDDAMAGSEKPLASGV